MDPYNDDTNIISDNPIEIANKLFSTNPKEPFTYNILAYPDMNDNIYIFEILMTILMEGLAKLSDKFTNIDLTKFTKDNILILNPWFKSIGFNLYVEVFNKVDKHLYEDYYCKIIIKIPLYETLFLIKKINKSYHFLINGLFLKENFKKEKLNKLSAVFINEDDKVYKIYFDLLRISTN